ncbi:MAG: hypothetical protein HC789_21320 [Microcoleus sp. CSU_2_2]|nr:hypothetical protein [Microcoleus sp. SU_5_3]NJS12728.1 hypothetical protein [Microcoleus sp. CSU_2_2]
MSPPSIEGGLLHVINSFGAIDSLYIPPFEVAQERMSIGVRSINNLSGKLTAIQDDRQCQQMSVFRIL